MISQVSKQNKKKKRRHTFRNLILVLILVVLVAFGTFWGARLYHVYMTSTGKQDPDTPDAEEYPVQGVDVSYYQGTVDWDALYEQGITFAFLKATEGVSHGDTSFAENWANALTSNVYVGAYHYYRFEEDGAAQAEHFIETVPYTENTLPPVVDVELYDSLTEEPDTDETVENLQEMLETLESYYGVKPILYVATNCYLLYAQYFEGEYPIWISNYYYEPYIDWTFWQYTDEGALDGYDGDQQNIDLNVYAGSFSEFLAEFSLTEKT